MRKSIQIRSRFSWSGVRYVWFGGGDRLARTIRLLWMTGGAVLALGCGPMDAAHGDAGDRAQPAQVAERKAAILEQAASAEGADPAAAKVELITKREVQAVDPQGSQPLDDPITCLARTIYWEAKGESEVAMEAVANVVVNRLEHAGFPNSVCDVVKQGGEDGACQFSWWCDGRADAVEEDERYHLAKDIARRALNGQLPDRTNGATYFHHERLAPSWSNEYVKTGAVGDHVFYRSPNGDAR